MPAEGPSVFVVFGHRKALADELEAILGRLGVRVVTLKSWIRPGAPIAVALEKLARDSDAAIILATADDVGRGRSQRSEAPCARENVWLEYGWFWAALGQSERSCF
jgi:predicted nucleotide-binding protein